MIKSVTSARIPGLSGQCNNSLAVVIIVSTILLIHAALFHCLRFKLAKITNYCKIANNLSKKFTLKARNRSDRKIGAQNSKRNKENNVIILRYSTARQAEKYT